MKLGGASRPHGSEGPRLFLTLAKHNLNAVRPWCGRMHAFLPVRTALSHRLLPVTLTALALALSAPAWRAPFSGDDLVQAGKLLPDHPVKQHGYFPQAHRFGRATMSLFDWFGPGLTRRAVDHGVLPWWTAEGAQQSFWRPLSAATHWLDYRLWTSRALPMHVHNALWFAALLLAAWALYRGLAGRAWEAGLAALVLALNQENWQPLVWIAARNSFITAFFVAIVLLLHHRNAQTGSRACGVGAWAAVAAGLLAGEGAVTATAYLVSYSVFIDPRPWKTRVLGLVPFALVVVVWRAAYQALGFGVASSGLYVDPGTDPWRYLLNLLEWGPILLLDVFAAPILGKYASLAPQLRPLARGAGMVALVVLIAGLVPLLRRQRTARFWALGCVLALVPACATTVPDDRITLYAMLGFAPLAASFMAGVLDSASWVPRAPGLRLYAQAAAILLAGFHLVLPLPGHARRLSYLLRPAAGPASVPAALRSAPDQDLVFVNTPDVMYLSYLPYFLVRDGASLPARMRVLSSALGDVTLRRPADNALSLTASCGPLIPVRPRVDGLPAGAPLRHPLYTGMAVATAFRPDGVPFAPGEPIALPGMSVVVDRLDANGTPAEATFMFEHSLDDARYRWVYWDSAQQRYAPFTPPRIGQSRRLAGPLPSAE